LEGTEATASAFVKNFFCFVLLHGESRIAMRIDLSAINRRRFAAANQYENFFRLLPVGWSSAQVHETITFFDVTLSDVHRF